MGMTRLVKQMVDDDKTFIKDVEMLREFIKMNKRKEDYFDHIVEKVISKGSK